MFNNDYLFKNLSLKNSHFFLFVVVVVAVIVFVLVFGFITPEVVDAHEEDQGIGGTLFTHAH